ncbi:hypothetical protein BSKO_09695 [Bryopsis sp. KO-2023]|nr:hypothetical protein BSKO_09695 [Bryopsis sp. KO-2023]
MNSLKFLDRSRNALSLRSRIHPRRVRSWTSRKTLCRMCDTASFSLAHRDPQWGNFKCVSFAPENPSTLGLVVLSDVYGMSTDHTRKQMMCFRERGWTCLLPDLFREHPHPLPHSAFTAEQRETWRETYATPYERIVDMACVCHDFLVKEKCVESVGLVGYCYGGGRLTETLAATANGAGFDAGVAFYGTRIDPEVVKKVVTPVLFLFGETDPLVPLELVEAIKSQSNGKVVVFEGRGHGFVHQPSAGDEEDSQKAMEIALAWLKEHVKVPNT